LLIFQFDDSNYINYCMQEHEIWSRNRLQTHLHIMQEIQFVSRVSMLIVRSYVTDVVLNVISN